MNIKDFAQEFIDNVKTSVDLTGNDYDQELATSILEYIEDNGEVNAPEICTFQKTRARITAYDYNDEEYYILGAQKGLDDCGMADRNMARLRAGDMITTLHKAASTTTPMTMGDTRIKMDCHILERLFRILFSSGRPSLWDGT